MALEGRRGPIDRGDANDRLAGESDTRARFDAIVIPQMDSVYRVALAIARDEAEAQDLVQETFLKAFRAFDRFELRDYGPRPWLLRILHNVLYSLRGKEHRQPGLLDDVNFDHFIDELDEPVSEPGSIHEIDWDGFDEEVKFAIAELRPEYREVLLLWAVEGLTYKEISHVCGCAIGTVMSRLYRARRLLSRELSDFAREHGLSDERR